MDGKLNLFEAIGRKMAWLAQRQSVLAQNIANADTPDFKPQDLKAGPFSRLLASKSRSAGPMATHPKHIDARQSANGPFRSNEQPRFYETAPSGNAVVLEEQLIKVAETQMDYQTMSNLYRKHLQMIRAALGR